MAIFVNRKKKHFKEAVRNLEKKMWDAEFLITKRREEREGYRIEYDRITEMLDAATLRLSTEKEKAEPDKTICANLENAIKRFSQDSEQLKKQMEAIDKQIDGFDYEEQNQKIHQEGLLESIDNFRALISLVKKHARHL